MLQGERNSRGKLKNAPAAFIHPRRPIVAKQPPSGPGWVHELKHDDYRIQIHIRDGRVLRLYTMNGNDWSKRYPLIIQDAAKIKGSAIIDAEAVWLGLDGAASFDALHSRLNDYTAAACAFDLLMFNDEDVRRRAQRHVLRNTRTGIQYVEHTEGDGGKLFDAVCKLGLEGIVSKRLDAPYRSGPSKSWIKVKNPKAPAAIRVIDGTF